MLIVFLRKVAFEFFQFRFLTNRLIQVCSATLVFVTVQVRAVIKFGSVILCIVHIGSAHFFYKIDCKGKPVKNTANAGFQDKLTVFRRGLMGIPYLAGLYDSYLSQKKDYPPGPERTPLDFQE